MPGGILLTKEGELHARRKRPNGRIDPQGRNMGELVARLHAPAGGVLRRTDPAFFDPRPPPPDHRHHTEDRESAQNTGIQYVANSGLVESSPAVHRNSCW